MSSLSGLTAIQALTSAEYSPTSVVSRVARRASISSNPNTVVGAINPGNTR